jgi:hypothetical protein
MYRNIALGVHVLATTMIRRRTVWLFEVLVIVLTARINAWTQNGAFRTQQRRVNLCDVSLYLSKNDGSSSSGHPRHRDVDSSESSTGSNEGKLSSASLTQKNYNLMLQVMNQNVSSPGRPPELLPVKYVGSSVEFPTMKSSRKLVKCMILQQSSLLGDDGVLRTSTRTPQPCLFVPTTDGAEDVLTALRKDAPWSKTTLLRQNYRVIHRTDGIYDQLPYHWWNSNDPESTMPSTLPTSSLNMNLGKRECYNLLLGKDWYLWSTTPKVTSSVANPTIDATSEGWVNDSAWVLQNRMYTIQVQEYQMKIAECDSEIAYLSVQQDSGSADNDINAELLRYWREQRKLFVQLLNETVEQQETQMKAQLPSMEASDASKINDSMVSSWIQNMLRSQWSRNETPAGIADDDRISPKVLPYQNTYDMIRRLICQDRLNADVIGIVLENTCLLDSGLTLGGVIVLQKRRPPQEVRVLGETISMSSVTLDDESIYVVECHVDEAIGMGIACDLPVWIESDTWKRGTVMGQPAYSNATTEWAPLDPELSVLPEGQSKRDSITERVLPIQSSRNLNLYDNIVSLPASSEAKDLFPTDNLVRSLSQYDQMSMDDKVRTMFAMSNFQESLPRRRVVLQNPSVLDQLLLPLVDESVRYEWSLRDAQERNDVARIQELQERQSQRSKAKMNAERANLSEVEKEYCDKEVEFYSSLRADATQDEGSYSRFLDRDEWYERDRQRMVKRMLDREKNN